MKRIISTILAYVAVLVFASTILIAIIEIKNDSPSDYLFALTFLLFIILGLATALTYEPKGKQDYEILDDFEI